MTDNEATSESDGADDAGEAGAAGERAWDGTPPSVRIVEAVADATGTDPTELPPLHDSLDPDALDDLVGRGPDADGRTVRLAFSYAGVEVTVVSDGSIDVDA